MEFELNGFIVCIDNVWHVRVRPNHQADNPDDFYGYEYVEFDLLAIVDEDGSEVSQRDSGITNDMIEERAIEEIRNGK